MLSTLILCKLFTILVAKESEKNSGLMVKKFDIWNVVMAPKIIGTSGKNYLYKSIKNSSHEDINNEGHRKSKVFHLFPVPADGECLSIDGRRTGICLNVYECRLKGGNSQGECSMGFGVCCVFHASCDQIISNNITYLLSPNFPSSMPNNFTSCKIKVQIIDTTISQLRIDFNHFSLGQPNRRNGVCDGDAFIISGGLLGNFSLCGQNSGQHIYYDVAPMQNRSSLNETLEKKFPKGDGNVEIAFNFSKRFSIIRFWEIRIAQIPFSQRAPAGCLQYFAEPEGVIQTFNFADNGRHLANQHYRSCIRQGTKMCSIIYQPCDDQSFKIGPSKVEGSTQNNIVPLNLSLQDSLMTQAQAVSESSSISPVSLVTNSSDSLSNDVEGSGEESSQLMVSTSTRPVRGGFDILSLFRNAFSFENRSQRQIFTICSDRITMPCIIEDFVSMGVGPLPGCEPVHCGSQFCSSGIKPCRIESTVTPFYLGINFGDGLGKGSAEDNIGACIRYTQMQCL